MTGPRSAIAERIKQFLVPALHPVVDARVEEGLRKYGQTLDDNVKPERAKAVHQLQELLDAMNYRAWRANDTVGERPGTAELADHAERRQDLDLSQLARMANDLVRTEFPDLILEEMLYREGHNGRTDQNPDVQSIAARLAAVRHIEITDDTTGQKHYGFKIGIGDNTLESLWHCTDDRTHPDQAEYARNGWDTADLYCDSHYPTIDDTAMLAFLLHAQADMQTLLDALARLQEERDAYRKGITTLMNLHVNVPPIDQQRELATAAWKQAEDIVAQHGCTDCTGKTFDDGQVACWTCGRVLPDALKQDGEG